VLDSTLRYLHLCPLPGWVSLSVHWLFVGSALDFWIFSEDPLLYSEELFLLGVVW
jgi:hypothetical protein